MGNEITVWISEAQNADPQAAQRIWDEYFERLIVYAKKKMSGLPRRSADEEDVALSAMNSFFEGVQQGKFLPKDRDELWKLLATITVRKATREWRKHYSQKRGGGEVRGESVFHAAAQQTSGFGINEAMAPDNLPVMSRYLTATCEEMLEVLGDDALKTVAKLRLEGFSNDEISEELQVSRATIKRKLAKIREIWSVDAE